VDILKANVSAEGFIDRTKGWNGTSNEALKELIKIKSSNGEINHTTMPEFAKASYKEPIRNYINETYEEEIIYRQVRHNRKRLWPTLGIFALDLALCVEKPRKIFMFGIDFFDKLTYATYGGVDYANTDTKVHQNGMVDLMKYHVEQLIKEFPDVEFHTSSKVLKIKKSQEVPKISFKETGSVHYDKRTYSIKGNSISLFTTNGRIKAGFDICDFDTPHG